MSEQIEYVLKLLYQYKDYSGTISKSISLYDTSLDNDVSLSREIIQSIESSLSKNNIRFSREGKQLHFQSNNVTNNLDWIAIHINIDEDGCPTLIEMLTKYFLANTNIEYDAFLSNERKADQIVLYVRNMSVVNDINKLILSNRDLWKFFKQANPFLVSNGKLGMSFDHTLDVNEFISYLVGEYLASVQNLEEISYVSFKAFLSYFHNGLRNSPEYLQTFRASDVFKKGFDVIKSKKPTVNDVDVMLYYVVILEQILYCNNYGSFEKFISDALTNDNNSLHTKLEDNFKSARQ